MHSSVTSPEAKSISANGRYYRAGSFGLKRLVSNDRRYAIVISKRQGKAHERNRVKRVIRELLRHRESIISDGLYLLYFRGLCSRMNRERIAADIDKVLETIKTGIEKESTSS